MHTKNKNPNHIIHEKSPYLLQHAYNPVNWYPWSEEAFTKAKNENKPIFLSIGYSTCHWCHVMERESFEDREVAAVLNESFVAIKVDKEERPDVDSIYMTVCTALHGHGGWPLTVVMTPDQKPFFAGTYLPKHANGQMTGLMELLEGVAKMWHLDRGRLESSSEELTQAVKEHIGRSADSNERVKANVLGLAFHNYVRMFDTKYGGFGDAPKFPTPHNLIFLLRYAKQYQNEEALKMVEETLQHMYRGGIYDHVGGGFARYSTDERWLVPHFEKMLYDNALLAIAYTEAYQMTKNPLYQEIVTQIFAYIEREMTSEEGGFYCAQDADSEGEEGKYYVFTPKEVKQVLGEEVGTIFNERYDITDRGNFEGRSIPNLIGVKDLFLAPEQMNSMESTWSQQIELARYKLMEYRRKRTKLHKDDKILTSWNALMITAYAKAYQVFGVEEYLTMATKCLEFVNRNLCDDQGRLFIRYREGQSVGVGVLDDYAFLCWATYELYEATFEPEYLKQSIQLMNCMIKHFWDNKGYGFYYSAKDGEQLILRPKELYDGAMPSGNSVAAYLLQRLSRMTGDEKFMNYADWQLEFMAAEVNDYPNGYAFALMAYLDKFSMGKDLVTVVSSNSEAKAVQMLLKENYEPELVVIQKILATSEELIQLIPYVSEHKQIDGRSTYYVCANHTCYEPFCEISKLIPMLTEPAEGK